MIHKQTSVFGRQMWKSLARLSIPQGHHFHPIRNVLRLSWHTEVLFHSQWHGDNSAYFFLYSNPEIRSSNGKIVLGEGNHSHCLVTQNRRNLEETHAGILLSERIYFFFLYSSLFAVCALYLKCIAWFPAHCTFHVIYLFIPLYVHNIQSINLVCCPYILSLQIIIAKKLPNFSLCNPEILSKTHDHIHLLTRKSFYRIYMAADLK